MCTAPSFLCAPDEPGTPFAAAVIWFDLVRVLAIGGGLVLLVGCLVAMRGVLDRQQAARFVALGGFAAICIGTEVEHLGDVANYRLFITAAAVAVGLWGMGDIRELVRR